MWTKESLPMTPSTMPSDPARTLPAMTVRGICAISFVVSALLWPPKALVARVLVFAAYALVDGVFSLFAATAAAEGGMLAVPIAIEGVMSLIGGVILMQWSGIEGVPLHVLIGAWSTLMGTAQGLAALRLRKHPRRERLLALAGLLSLIGGLLSFAVPDDRVTLGTIWLGAYAVLFGGILIGLSLRPRRSLLRSLPGGKSAASTRTGVVLRIADWQGAMPGRSAATINAHRPRVT
jgi:uncharacterized membrane protein HdeD (DUF308 family)